MAETGGDAQHRAGEHTLLEAGADRSVVRELLEELPVAKPQAVQTLLKELPVAKPTKPGKEAQRAEKVRNYNDELERIITAKALASLERLETAIRKRRAEIEGATNFSETRLSLNASQLSIEGPIDRALLEFEGKAASPVQDKYLDDLAILSYRVENDRVLRRSEKDLLLAKIRNAEVSNKADEVSKSLF